MNNIQKQNQKKKRKGFTLIELIIVLAVMAIIAAIAIPNFAAVTANSKKKADIQSCETVKRISLTLVAQGDMPTGTYIVDPSKTTGDERVTIGGKATTPDISSYFKDVKKPKSKEDSTFTIVVKDGDIESVYLTADNTIKAE